MRSVPIRKSNSGTSPKPPSWIWLSLNAEKLSRTWVEKSFQVQGNWELKPESRRKESWRGWMRNMAVPSSLGNRNRKSPKKNRCLLMPKYQKKGYGKARRSTVRSFLMKINKIRSLSVEGKENKPSLKSYNSAKPNLRKLNTRTLAYRRKKLYCRKLKNSHYWEELIRLSWKRRLRNLHWCK